jgi:hypothetical protein
MKILSRNSIGVEGATKLGVEISKLQNLTNLKLELR